MKAPFRLAIVVLLILLGACATPVSRFDAPNVTLADLRLANIGLFEQRFDLQLRLQNPNNADLPITGMEFKLSLNDIEFGRGVSRQTVTVPAYGEALVNVEVVSNVARLVEEFKQLDFGRGEGVRYRLSGGMSLGNRGGKIPFEYSGEIGGKATKLR